MYVNEKCKYFACSPHKAGSSARKAILLNNSIEELMPANFNPNNRLHQITTKCWTSMDYSKSVVRL